MQRGNKTSSQKQSSSKITPNNNNNIHININLNVKKKSNCFHDQKIDNFIEISKSNNKQSIKSYFQNQRSKNPHANPNPNSNNKSKSVSSSKSRSRSRSCKKLKNHISSSSKNLVYFQNSGIKKRLQKGCALDNHPIKKSKKSLNANSNKITDQQTKQLKQLVDDNKKKKQKKEKEKSKQSTATITEHNNNKYQKQQKKSNNNFTQQKKSKKSSISKKVSTFNTAYKDQEIRFPMFYGDGDGDGDNDVDNDNNDNNDDEFNQQHQYYQIQQKQQPLQKQKFYHPNNDNIRSMSQTTGIKTIINPIRYSHSHYTTKYQKYNSPQLKQHMHTQKKQHTASVTLLSNYDLLIKGKLTSKQFNQFVQKMIIIQKMWRGYRQRKIFLKQLKNQIILGVDQKIWGNNNSGRQQENSINFIAQSYSGNTNNQQQQQQQQQFYQITKFNEKVSSSSNNNNDLKASEKTPTPTITNKIGFVKYNHTHSLSQQASSLSGNGCVNYVNNNNHQKKKNTTTVAAVNVAAADKDNYLNNSASIYNSQRTIQQPHTDHKKYQLESARQDSQKNDKRGIYTRHETIGLRISEFPYGSVESYSKSSGRKEGDSQGSQGSQGQKSQTKKQTNKNKKQMNHYSESYLTEFQLLKRRFKQLEQQNSQLKATLNNKTFSERQSLSNSRSMIDNRSAEQPKAQGLEPLSKSPNSGEAKSNKKPKLSVQTQIQTETSAIEYRDNLKKQFGAFESPSNRKLNNLTERNIKSISSIFKKKQLSLDLAYQKNTDNYRNLLQSNIVSPKTYNFKKIQLDEKYRYQKQLIRQKMKDAQNVVKFIEEQNIEIQLNVDVDVDVDVGVNVSNDKEQSPDVQNTQQIKDQIKQNNNPLQRSDIKLQQNQISDRFIQNQQVQQQQIQNDLTERRGNQTVILKGGMHDFYQPNQNLLDSQEKYWTDNMEDVHKKALQISRKIDEALEAESQRYSQNPSSSNQGEASSSEAANTNKQYNSQNSQFSAEQGSTGSAIVKSPSNNVKIFKDQQQPQQQPIFKRETPQPQPAQSQPSLLQPDTIYESSEYKIGQNNSSLYSQQSVEMSRPESTQTPQPVSIQDKPNVTEKQSQSASPQRQYSQGSDYNFVQNNSSEVSAVSSKSSNSNLQNGYDISYPKIEQHGSEQNKDAHVIGVNKDNDDKQQISGFSNKNESSGAQAEAQASENEEFNSAVEQMMASQPPALQNQPQQRGFDTRLTFIKEYLIALSEYLRSEPIFRSEFINSIVQPISYDYLQYLKSYRTTLDNQYDTQYNSEKQSYFYPYFHILSQGGFNKALSQTVCDRFEFLYQEAYQTNLQLTGQMIEQRKYFLQLIFDVMNESLNFQRPGGVYGQSLPWRIQSKSLKNNSIRQLSRSMAWPNEEYSQQQEERLDKIFGISITKVIEWGSCLCGFIPEPISFDNQQSYQAVSIDQEQTELVRQTRLAFMLEKAMIEGEQQMHDSTKQQLEVMLHLQRLIFEKMINEVAQEIYQIIGQ